MVGSGGKTGAGNDESDRSVAPSDLPAELRAAGRLFAPDEGVESEYGTMLRHDDRSALALGAVGPRGARSWADAASEGEEYDDSNAPEGAVEPHGVPAAGQKTVPQRKQTETDVDTVRSLPKASDE